MSFDVFISYSTRDAIAAKAACAAMEAAKIRCWIAPRDIVAGAKWGASIVRAINRCRVMVLIFSGNANDSAQVQREIGQAFGKGKAVLPLRIEDVKPSDELAYYLDTVHWLDALTPPLERNLEKLVATVQALLHTMEPAPASGEPVIDDAAAQAQDAAHAEDERRLKVVEAAQRGEAAQRDKEAAEAARRKEATVAQRIREETEAQHLAQQRGWQEAESETRAREAEALQRAEGVARSRREAEHARAEKKRAFGPSAERQHSQQSPRRPLLADGRMRFMAGSALVMTGLIVTASLLSWAIAMRRFPDLFDFAFILGPPLVLIAIGLATMRGSPKLKWISIGVDFIAILFLSFVGIGGGIGRVPDKLEVTFFAVIFVSAVMVMFVSWRAWNAPLEKPLLTRDWPGVDLIVALFLLACPFWAISLLFYFGNFNKSGGFLVVCVLTYFACLLVTFICSKLWIANNRSALRDAAAA